MYKFVYPLKLAIKTLPKKILAIQFIIVYYLKSRKEVYINFDFRN